MMDNYSEPTISDFIENAAISTRLRNALNSIANRSTLLKEIKEVDLFVVRNIGRVSMKEFVGKRDEYLRGWRLPRVTEELNLIVIRNPTDILSEEKEFRE